VIENNSRKQTKRGHSDNFSRVILAGTNFGYPEADKKKGQIPRMRMLYQMLLETCPTL